MLCDICIYSGINKKQNPDKFTKRLERIHKVIKNEKVEHEVQKWQIEKKNIQSD